MTEHRSLKTTAIIICVFALLIAALSGLCSILFTVNDQGGAWAYFAIGAIGFIPFGLLAIAMAHNIRRGPNLLSEITAGLVGLILTIICLFGYRFLGVATGWLNLLFAIPGLLILGWAIWSFSHRTASHEETSNDPFR